ncbi:MAG: VTT domain-containing protein [Planctomycetes bacterium]|nr:VTT domain-containing protein [Planctomycetota bacterium]
MSANDWLPAIFEWIGTLGAWGVGFVLLLYFPAALLAMPVAWITMGAGALYGPWTAFGLATAGGNLAANVAFYLGKRLGRERFQHWMLRYPRLAEIEGAVGRDAFRFVFLCRLSPVAPYGVLNYAFSMMRVSQGRFALGTLFGKTPGNLFYCFLGAGARSVVDAVSGNVEKGSAHYWILALGVVATGLLLIMLTGMAKKALRAP